jgi:hypothetical protein
LLRLWPLLLEKICDIFEKSGQKVGNWPKKVGLWPVFFEKWAGLKPAWLSHL